MRSLLKPLISLLMLGSLMACSITPGGAPTTSDSGTRAPIANTTATSVSQGRPTSSATAPAVDATAVPTVTPLPQESSPTPATEAPTATSAAGDESGTLLYVLPNAEARSSELWRLSLADGSQQMLLSCDDECGIAALAVAPDGRQVAYAANRLSGERGLYIADLDGSNVRLLVSGDVMIGPDAFAPDGSRLAFVLRQPSEAIIAPSAVFVVDVDGGEPRQLTPYHGMLSDPAWLDGETLIAAVSQTMGDVGTTLRIAAGSEQEPEVLSEGRALGLSPDRKKLLLALSPITDSIAADQRFAFRVLSLEQEQPQVLADLSLTMGSSIWSPDATRLLHAGMQNLALVDVQTGDQEILQTFDGKHVFLSRPVWTADGRSVIYSVPVFGEQPATEIRQLDIGGAGERVLATIPGSSGLLLAVAH